jgi:hypothetical protein
MKKTIPLSALLVSLFLTSAALIFAERDLETGVFLSRDPAGFVDGPNVYSYVKQNPWSRFDPHGLNEAALGYDPATITPTERQAMIEHNVKAWKGVANTPRALKDGIQNLPNVPGQLWDAAKNPPQAIENIRQASNEMIQNPEKLGEFFGTALAGSTLSKFSRTRAVAASAVPKPGSSPDVPAPGASPTATANPLHGPFHRRQSPTQTPADAALIIESGELHGLGPRQSGGGRGIPQVQAYDGPLPPGVSGIEFKTPVAPTPGTPPGQVRWVKDEPGIEPVDIDRVKIPVTVTKNTQTGPKP